MSESALASSAARRGSANIEQEILREIGLG